MRLVGAFLTTLILTLTSLGGPASATAHYVPAEAVVAYATGYDLEVIEATWNVPATTRVALERAVSLLGTPYRYASTDPSRGVDCSGFVAWVWGLDVSYSGDQIDLAVPVDIPRAGDLVYYPGHIAIYLGVGDWVIHSANHSTGVTISEIHRDVVYGRLAAGTNAVVVEAIYALAR